eukprot:GFKZ01010639.1.p1 GENE.GFKZ01010639.1~~GFKZ01010639.1.p1  ORF type:complete len:393 (-),score=24.42 GFKZ01010639.1:680-1693(-)
MDTLTFSSISSFPINDRFGARLPPNLCTTPSTTYHAVPMSPAVVQTSMGTARPHSKSKRPRGPSRNSRGQTDADDVPRKPNINLGEQERLQKVMSRLGFASRRQSEAMISEGRVRVNGRKILEQGTLVNPRSDRIMVDGAELAAAEKAVWVAVHKPRGYLSVAREGAKRTVRDLVPKARAMKLATVGSLDASFSGLVIMTNERGCIPQLVSPDHPHVKHWFVDCEGVITDQMVAPLRSGIQLEGDTRATVPADVKILGSEKVELSRGRFGALTRIEVRLRDSRQRLIKRMFDALGIKIVSASRRGVGPILLGSLKRGSFRYLTPNEIKALKRGVKRK